MATADQPAEVARRPDVHDHGLRSGVCRAFDANWAPGACWLPIAMGWLVTESRRSRREREALAIRLAALPPGDVPADVVSLVASGKKIQAISRYRQLTGTSLSEARAVIDGL